MIARWILAPAAAALLVPLTGCGAGPATTPSSTGAASTPTAVAPPTTSPPPSEAATASPAGLTPGTVRFRVVNLGHAPVDIYVRSQGVVEAELVDEGLTAGQASDYFAPPDPGALVVTEAGAGDPTCVTDCDHFVGDWSTTAGRGDQITVFVYDGGAVDLWEHPSQEDVGRFANALPPADASQAMLIAVGQAVSGAEFGLRLAYAGEDGCRRDMADSNLLVGGTSMLPFAFEPGSVEVSVFPATDTDCGGDPIGGPFTVAGSAGSQTLLLLWGSLESVEAVSLPIP